MRRQDIIIAALFLGSGAALLVYILSGISLLITFSVILAGAVVIGVIVWKTAPDPKKADLKKKFRIGLIAGLLAMIAYDLSRLLLVTLTPMTVWPFEAFMVFGQAFIGEEIRSTGVFLLGVIYHIVNALAFAVAYTLAFGKKGTWYGLAWAMILEVVMLLVYPGWLNIHKIGQFITMSFFGHVFYGIVLGYSAKRLLLRNEGE